MFNVALYDRVEMTTDSFETTSTRTQGNSNKVITFIENEKGKEKDCISLKDDFSFQGKVG